MKWNISRTGIALFSPRRWHWLRTLRQVLRDRRTARSRRQTTEPRRAVVEVYALESRESVGGDVTPVGL
jgi:hypothetical protein